MRINFLDRILFKYLTGRDLVRDIYFYSEPMEGYVQEFNSTKEYVKISDKWYESSDLKIIEVLEKDR